MGCRRLGSFAAALVVAGLITFTTTGCSESPSATTTSVPSTSTPTSAMSSACPTRDLQECLQRALDMMVDHFVGKHPGLVMQIGFKNQSVDFGLASGVTNSRNATATDTFLYGSGTKPITATAVLRLIESGRVQGEDRVSALVDPYLQRWNGTTLRELYGDDVDNATVLDVIRMGAGIRDFEDKWDFDVATLEDGGFVEYPFGALRYAAEIGNGTLYCTPGTCTAYSSTSYELAGLVLAAALQPNLPWWEFDLGDAALPQRERFPTMAFPPKATQNGKISDSLTVPGTSVSSDWPNTEIFNQSSAILGWTCGNMVSSAQDVARFYFDLLHQDSQGLPSPSGQPGSDEAPRMLGSESRSQLLAFAPLSTGWMAGRLNYSAGLMELSYTYGSNRNVRDAASYSYAWGHAGDTYGFTSQQAYVPKAGAAFSVVSNVDTSIPSSHMACWLADILQEVETGVPGDFGCGYIDFGPAHTNSRRRRPASNVETGGDATSAGAPSLVMV